MHPVRVVLGKELAEIVGNRRLIASLCALPLVMVVVALAILATYTRNDIDVVLLTVARFYVPDAQPEQVKQIVLEAMVRNSIGMFLIMPLFLPVLIASHAIAGEKERRTLEPLLASPVGARELMLGKTLAAVIPALGVTVLAFAVFAIGADVIAWPVLGRLLLPDASFLFAVLVLAPLLSFLGTCVSVLISARVGRHVEIRRGSCAGSGQEPTQAIAGGVGGHRQ